MLIQYGWTGLLDDFGVNAGVRSEAIPYLTALMWSTPPLLAYAALRRYLQGMNLVKPVMFALVSANIVNAAADWVLIFGHLGFPAYGAAGAGWATCVSRIYMAGVLAVYVIWWNRKHDTGFFAISLRPDSHSIRRLLRLGLPAAAQMAFEVSVFAVATTLVGRLESHQLAAHHIALQAASTTYMVPLGIGSAAAVRVGHAIGRRDISSAVIAGWAAMLLGGLFMFSAGLVFIAMPEPLASVFTNQTRVIEATTALLAIAALFQLFDGLQAVATGALRGAGNTHTAAISHLICYWAVGLPSGYFLCFHMGWGAAGMWAGLCLALILIGLVLTAAWVAQTRQLARDN